MYYGAIKYNNTFMKSHLLLIENEMHWQLNFDIRKCNIFIYYFHENLFLGLEIFPSHTKLQYLQYIQYISSI